MVRPTSPLFTLHYFTRDTSNRIEGSPVITTSVKCITNPIKCSAEWVTTGTKSTSTTKLIQHLASEHPRSYLNYVEQTKHGSVKRGAIHIDTSSLTTSPSSLSTPVRTQSSSTSLLNYSFSNASNITDALSEENIPTDVELHDNALNHLIKFISVLIYHLG
jgi:hypothetical protein